MERVGQWKKKPVAFGSDVARLARSDRHEAHRRQQREQHLNRLRAVEMPENDEEEVIDTPEDRAARLEKWKAERDLKKKLEAKNKRPAFKIGVPHHKFFSPTSSDPQPHCHKKPKLPSPPKRVTAATLRRREAKATAAVGLANVEPPANSIKSALKPRNQIAKARTPVMTRSRRRAQLHEPPEEVKMPLAPKDYAFKIPTGIAPVPMFGRVVIPDAEMMFNFNLTDNTKMTKCATTEPQIEEAGGTPEKTPTPKKTPPEKFEQKTEVERSESTQTTDSSIESVVLRLSSQSDPSSEEDPEKENVAVNFATPNQSLKIMSPAYFSPYIVTSRGKSSARKEQKQRLSLFNSPDEVPTKDTVMHMLNISAEEEEKTAQYFKHLLQNEEDALRNLCTKWRAVQDDAKTSEDGHYLINQAIGQTDLLLHKKFEKFRQLVLDCETGRGEQLVRCADLQGFWEMMKMDVENCYTRFIKLDELKSRNWAEEENTETKVVKKKPVPIKKKKIVGKSNMRSFIEAARRKKLGENNAEEIPEEPQSAPKPLTPRRMSTTPPVSPHSRTRLTPRGERLSLLKLVQLTESARKKAQASFAMVKISQQLKTPEVHHDDTISYINSDQTPGKGILKKIETAPKSENRLNKSLRVNFNDTVEMSQLPVQEEEEEEEEEEDTSRSLAAALARIDSFDFGHDNIEERYSINKKLFEDDDDLDDDVFELNLPQPEPPSAEETPEGVSEQQEEVHTPPTIPEINVIAATPSTTLMPPPGTSTSRTRGRARRTADPESEAVAGVELPKPPKKGRKGKREDFGADQAAMEVTPSPVKPTRCGRSKSADDPPTDEIKIVVTEPTPAVRRSRSPINGNSEEMETENEETSTTISTPLNKSATEISIEPPTIEITEPTPAVRRSKSDLRRAVEGSGSEEIVFALPMPPKSPRRGRKKSAAETEQPKIVITEPTPVPKPAKRGASKSNAEIDIEAIIAMTPRVVLHRISADEIKKRTGSVDSVETEDADAAKPATPRRPRRKTRRHSEAPAKSQATGSRPLRNRSVLLENVLQRNHRSAKSDSSDEKIEVSETEDQEVDHKSDEGGDKENGDSQKITTPRTPRAPIPVELTPSRRSARKSVRFVPEEDCTICNSVPLTPRSLKARISFFGDHSDVVTQPLPNGDLMAFDSPATPRRARLRRSSTK